MRTDPKEKCSRRGPGKISDGMGRVPNQHHRLPLATSLLLAKALVARLLPSKASRRVRHGANLLS